jgi:3-hydroxyisobutyrate dehydrogenase
VRSECGSGWSGGSLGGCGRAERARRLRVTAPNGTVLVVADTTRVAFLGTGAMGAPMASNVARAGLDVRAWNRTRDRAEPLAADGVEVVETAAEAAEGADVVVTMLSDGPAVEKAVVGTLAPDRLWLQMSTVGVDWTERLADTAGEAGAVFVDAPVLGSIRPAATGDLTILASGPEEARERAQPVFDAVGSRTLWLGEAGAGTRQKLVMNYWALAVTAVAGETIALAETLGVGGERFIELIEGQISDSPYARMKAPLMLERDYPPSFRLELGRKDVALAVEAAREAGVELSVGEAVVDEMERAIERGYGDGDIAAVIEATRPGSD